MTSDCLFCRIIAGEIPSTSVYEDDDLFAFRDINPAAPTHVLVIPKAHISGISAADDSQQALLGKLMIRAKHIAKEQGLADNGYRLVINNGEQGGQTVYHLHLHILGGRDMNWPPG